MTPKKAEQHKRDEPVTIEVQPRSRVRWGDRVWGPGRRLVVPRDQLAEVEGDYEEITE